MNDHKIDELLELIWTQREEGKKDLGIFLKTTKEENVRDALPQMEKEGLISIKNNNIELEEKGEKRAKDIIRRHRLAERLLFEVLDVELEHADSEACKFEHLLSREVTDSVCTFLGHPPLCPHGKHIPRGECCTKFKKELKPIVVSLRDLEPGEEGKIVFITPKVHKTIDRLTTLGVLPGSVIKLHQKRPSYVIKIDETDLALDELVAREIYVKKKMRTLK